MKTLRPYQQDAINAINSKLQSGITKQIVVLPTGGGKTFLAVKALAPFKKILWATHTEELLEQSGIAFLHELFPDVEIQKRIDAEGGLLEYIKSVKKKNLFADPIDKEIVSKIGIVKAENFDINAEIVLASLQTLHKRLDKINPETFDAVVIDECHLSSAKTYVKSINHFKPKLLCGLTATPHRADGASLGDIYDEIVFQYRLFDAINDGYLCEIDAIACRTDINLDSVRTTAGELNQGDLRQTVDTPERNKFIVECYKKYADGLQNLVFCVDMEHAKNVCQAFNDAGYKSEFVVSDETLTTDRRGSLQRFKSKQIQVLVNVMIYTAGTDIPIIGCLTLACPTKSLTKFYQQLGRCTRTLPGVIDGLDTPELRKTAIAASDKKKAIVLDIVDNTSRHRIVNTWTIDKDKPVAEKVFITTSKRGQLFEEEEAEKRKRKLDALRKQDERINLFALPKFVENTSIKMTEPASQAQLKWLKDLGYDIVNNTYTKGSASAIISNLPATKTQIKDLRAKGYDVPSNAIRGEINAAEWEIKKRLEAEAISNFSTLNSLTIEVPI